MRKSHKHKLILLCIFAWACAAAGGILGLASYSSRAGAPASSTQLWPASSAIHLDPTHANLLMFIHPQCPCSKASINELARLVARLPGKLHVTVVAAIPPNLVEKWRHSPLLQQASIVPDTTINIDINSTETNRFGAKTSGQVILYDKQGKLLFAGGITAARGHEGDNAGSDDILSLIQRGSSQQQQTPVYGCTIPGSDSAKRGS